MALLSFFKHFLLIFKGFHEKLMIIEPQLCGVGVTKDPTQTRGACRGGGSKSGHKLFIEIAKCHSNQIKKSLLVFAEKSTSK